ncbi:MAG: pyridoxamine 5'-phosphate oxidase family protein [Burkholderiales bacterium]|nr:pyridoxamine 5'-phosphate oxidase family protein [Burkholderiales bacterium]
MDPDAARSLRTLLATRPVAALGTLHRGDPAVSMVPFVLPTGQARVLIHVSALATHTADMLQHPRVSLLVMDEPRADTAPQALARVTLQAQAQALPRDDAGHAQARAAYLARFPQAAITFELGDFSLFVLQPVSARLVAGFGRAYSLVGDALADWLCQGPASAPG